ncbi:MAG: Dabb family protein [Geobacteraceae bacterium]|nr:Dabb family protein [Geobacteraceae bacterium]
MITHIVFFRLSDPSPVNLRATQDMLCSMQGKIPQLRHLEVGTDLVKSDRSYDLALVTRFDSLDDLQSYQEHPYHADTVVPFIKQIASATATVDYEK